MFKKLRRNIKDKNNAHNMHELGPEKSRGYNSFGRGAIYSSLFGIVGVGLIIVAFSIHTELTIRNFIPLILLYLGAVCIPLSELFVPIHKLHMQAIVAKNKWFYIGVICYGVFLISLVLTLIILLVK
ncbi:MAG: hypothetical protein IKQ31_00240 [Clostridia bacterium]|nr:hypothetical protein [Clostridia bacterium]